MYANQGSQRGFTMVELIMVIVMMGVIGGIVAVFMRSPIDAYFDSARRAGLTDMADTVVRRMARDLQRALPNSIRSAGDQCVEFIPTKTGGRYRADVGGGGDVLDFTVADSSFNMLGANSTLPPEQKIVAGDVIVVFNLGIPGADAYDDLIVTSPATENRNRTLVSSTAPVPLSEAGGETTIPIDSWQFPLASPSKRFHVIAGGEQVVRYMCIGATGVTDLDANGRGKGTLYRQVLNLPLAAGACPTTAPSSGAAVMATKVSACKFDYGGLDLQRNALVSMALSMTDSGETVGLHQEVHVSNEP